MMIQNIMQNPPYTNFKKTCHCNFWQHVIKRNQTLTKKKEKGLAHFWQHAIWENGAPTKKGLAHHSKA
jgi:hypothetical protein